VRLPREGVLALALLAVIGICSAASPYFATSGNLLAVARRSMDLAVLALGQTLVLAAGGIDVAAGVAMGIACVAVGRAVEGGWPPVAAALAGPVVGLCLGGVTATAVVAGRMPPIVATLALFGVWRAALYGLLGGEWLSGLPPVLAALVGNGRDLPPALPLIAALYGLTWIALRRTPAGPRLLAVGGRPEAARLAGISVPRMTASVYLASGLLSGVAATVYVAQYRNVEMTTGGTLALDSIVAAVLGGAAVAGGRISLLGTALGVALLRVIQNGFVLLGVASLWSPVVEGALLVLVLAGEGLPRLARRRRRAA
jgi:ribose/xylose/arabinose/galactoside ABC-type transport system permease subunit